MIIILSKKNPVADDQFEDLNIADKLPTDLIEGKEDAYIHLFSVITDHFAKESHLHKKLKDKDLYINQLSMRIFPLKSEYEKKGLTKSYKRQLADQVNILVDQVQKASVERHKIKQDL